MYIYKTKFSSRNRVATKSRLYRLSLISYYETIYIQPLSKKY